MAHLMKHFAQQNPTKKWHEINKKHYEQGVMPALKKIKKLKNYAGSEKP